jgi:hypothetical protein
MAKSFLPSHSKKPNGKEGLSDGADAISHTGSLNFAPFNSDLD